MPASNSPQTTHYSVEDAVTAAVIYADIFSSSLSTDQLQLWAIGRQVSQQDIATLSSKHLYQFQDRWCLASHRHIAEQWPAQKRILQQKLAQTNRWRWLFGLLPWVQLVAISGSVAGGNPKPDDDIDILIICQAHRMWLSRLFLTIALTLVGKRRKPTHNPHQVADLFCLNMWLSQQNLHEAHQTIYEANELARLHPIINRHHTLQRYLASNSWINHFLPNIPVNQPSASTPKPWPIIGQCLDALDVIAEKVLRQIMRPPTQEQITSTSLRFHPHNYRDDIIQKFTQVLTTHNLASPPALPSQAVVSGNPGVTEIATPEGS